MMQMAMKKFNKVINRQIVFLSTSNVLLNKGRLPNRRRLLKQKFVNFTNYRRPVSWVD